MFVWFSILLFSACTRWERAENTYKAILEKDPVDSVSASFSSILGYFDWLDLCDAKFVLGRCDCRKQNSTITIVVINAFCYLKKILLMYAAASIKKIILIKDLIFTKISKILFLFTAVTVFCSPIRN